ncbi:MAG: ATP synthase F0 subunit B [Candidatus Magnetoovum sp. WYHC-5]|nr:ATP synthase F0 subunit B [Candidatus Magnetoovum sp. WYHC-5]
MVEINGWFLVQVVNFIMLVFLLNRLLFKPLLSLFEKRENIISTSLKEAKLLDERKDRALKEMQDAIYEANRQANDTFIRLRQEGFSLQNDYIKTAQDNSLKTLYYALREISSESQRAKEAIKGEIEKYSDEIAKKFLH